MPWSTNPSAPSGQSSRWSTNPDPPSPPSMGKWVWMPRVTVADSAVGADLARLLRVAHTGIDQGVSADLAVAGVGLGASDAGRGADLARAKLRVAARDAGIGADSARSGVRATDSAVAAEMAQMLPRLAAVGAATAADIAVLSRVRLPSSASQAIGADTATARFSPQPAALTAITAVGTTVVPIPVWCRYLDLALVGAGGGGASSGTFYLLGGFPGSPGTWATTTLERGIHIPWTTTTLTFVIGAGGAKGSGGFAGTAGGPGAATTAIGDGWAGLSAAGGAGGPQHPTGINANDGPGPGDKTYNGVTYPGGATQTSDGATGYAPGGAGAGGANFGGPGGVGGAGGAWCRAYQ